MDVHRLRLLSAAVALGLAGVFAAAFPASAASVPPPLNEGPAGPPALLPNGQVASPPRVTALQVSASCPAAPYGSNSAAPGSGKTVALTFDDGPGASTAGILSILESYGVAATFFNIGQNAAARPQLVRQEAAAVYLLGNHTWDHPNMTTLPAAAQGTEMDRACVEQQVLTGTQPCAFRPPGGNYNATTLSLAQQRRMKFWTWSVDTEDWKANGSSSAYWMNRIISLAEQQGRVLQHPVVLMHNQPAGMGDRGARWRDGRVLARIRGRQPLARLVRARARLGRAAEPRRAPVPGELVTPTLAVCLAVAACGGARTITQIRSGIRLAGHPRRIAGSDCLW